ncbi:hypothetical protein [Arthrobacter gandavensis]|uniref:hypothetical protein n=1 Tax=Arthrobacter gandavensis TaxID=169960 RepID=UPI0014791A2D|nr:hypothetical protein [Arthrobacter gandavensis]
MAVLKNRLLDLTERGFRESEYGAPNMQYLAYLLQDMLEMESSDRSGMSIVRFKDELDTHLGVFPGPPLARGYSRLRRDIWIAFVDFRAGSYVWDTVGKRAIPGEAGPGKLAIPSLTSQQEAEMRKDFRANVSTDLAQADMQALDEWVTKRLGTMGLPPLLRGQWNGFMRESIASRVSKFFKMSGVEPPADMLATNSPSKTRQHSVTDDSRTVPHSYDLRAFILRCVDVMSEDELAALPLSASVCLRAQRAGH